MSRIGKMPVPIPKGVKVGWKDGLFSVEGPQGALARTLPVDVDIELKADTVLIHPRGTGRRSRAMHGLTRSLIHNMVTGVVTGFTKMLDIVGVGYRVEQKGEFLLFNLGYSHPILFELPEGITASVQQNTRILLQGYDKELLGQTAATIRGFRSPEPYKGKGIRYANETVRTKVGKSGV